MTTGLRHIATEPANLNHKPFGEMDRPRKRSPQPHIKKSGGGAATDSVRIDSGYINLIMYKWVTVFFFFLLNLTICTNNFKAGSK